MYKIRNFWQTCVAGGLLTASEGLLTASGRLLTASGELLAMR